eukprot:SAG31_NODE_18419_length_637_cov_0.947955_1_plen_164_part_00
MCQQISLVDLAVSEQVKRSEVTGVAFKEAVSVNKSLSSLLDVIDALANAERKGKAGDGHVPYRNHLLTELMRDSIGGSAKTLMFVNISPARSNLEETLGALGYASRASTITNNIKASKESKEVRRLKKTIERMMVSKSGSVESRANAHISGSGGAADVYSKAR